MKPLYKLFFVLLLSSIAFPSCSSDDDKDKNYSAILTDLKSKSGVIDEVYSESVNTLRDGVVVSEIDFNNAGERMHMFVARVDLDKVTIIASTPNDKPELPNPDATALFTPYLEGYLAPDGFSPDFVVSVDMHLQRALLFLQQK